MRYRVLLSNEEKDDLIKDLIAKNYNDKNTCFMESQIKLVIKGNKTNEYMMMWFITYDENNDFDQDIYFDYHTYNGEFEIKIRPHNARNSTGKRINIEIDDVNVQENYKKICIEYSNSRSQYSNNAHYKAFYDALYDILKHTKNVYLTEYK